MADPNRTVLTESDITDPGPLRTALLNEAIDNLDAAATTLPPGSPATVSVSGPMGAKVINVGIPRGEPGMGYEQGQQLLTQNQATLTQATQAATEASQAVTLAQQAQAAAYAIPDEAIDAIQSNAASASVQKSGVLVPAAIDHDHVQAALTTAAAGTFGPLRVQAGGAYTTSQTLTITSDCDLSGLTITYTGTGTAVEIGAVGQTSPQLDVVSPRVIFGGPRPSSFGGAGTVGVDIINLDSSHVFLSHVARFDTGVVETGDGRGCAYNVLRIGHLENNKVNLSTRARNGGWVNQVTHIGGRFSHYSNVGSNVAGVRHVRLHSTASAPANNHIFINCSFEGGSAEYHADIGGDANIFLNCRWEVSVPDNPRVKWASNSSRNHILYGYHSHRIQETFEEPVGTGNVIRSGVRESFNGSGGPGGLVLLENTSSSADPADVVMAAGATATKADPVTGYCVARGPLSTRMKRATDTHDRIVLDHVNGTLRLGSGTAAPNRVFGSIGTTMYYDGSHLVFLTDNTYDFGSTSLRPRYVRAGTAVVTGAAVTTGRPAASTAGAGAMFFDTTLGKPIWSTGSAWVDAMGSPA